MENGNKKEVQTATECFHCGLPLDNTSKAVPPLNVLGRDRFFCCHGCHAVCETIVEAGLEDYYVTRGDTVASQGEIPLLPEELGLFDREDIQKDFVTNLPGAKEATLLLEDIRCPSCIWLNEKHIRSLEGVISVSIDDLMSRAHVRWDPEKIKLSEILTAIAQIGYQAYPFDETKSKDLLLSRNSRSLEKVLFAGLVGMMVMNFSIVTYILVPDTSNPPIPLWVMLGRWSSLIATLIILIYSAEDFFVGAWRDIKAGRMGMDIPISLGLSIAFAASVWSTWQQFGEVYFDSIAMFVTFVLLARKWELSSRFDAVHSLDKLAAVQPQSASRLDGEGNAHITPVQELAVGDLILLKPGETLPVDVRLKSANSFDEAVLTGENIPVFKRADEIVRAGAVNLEHPVQALVAQPVSMSALTRLQDLVYQGVASKPEQQKLTEWVARWFVPTILLIAAATAVYWWFVNPQHVLPYMISVLIVTCPCALSLAAPAALSVAGARLMGAGVMPLDMSRLETMGQVDTAVFDKTGTLTHGRPVFVDAWYSDAFSQEKIDARACGLASQSEHPLSRALTRHLEDVSPKTFHQIQNKPGKGVEGFESEEGADKEQLWRLGAGQFVSGDDIYDASLKEFLHSAAEKGWSLVWIGQNDQVHAVFALQDEPRAGIADLLAGLKSRGVKQTYLLSGDQPASVKQFAKGLDFDAAHGALQPEDKYEFVSNLQKSGRKVLMVGDGLNDAATLAKADMAMSFAESTDMANINSDFMLQTDKLKAILFARDMARNTYRNIQISLAWALGYNLLAIPFAAAGYIPPWGAAIGMSLSSLIVVLNALRLRRTSHDL